MTWNDYLIGYELMKIDLVYIVKTVFQRFRQNNTE